ncbi:hypothetical protein Q3G72_027128 [Acer saccharum]|nr:hypothetical protein Q3G72_027128 [Acer saccharum]
MHVYGWPIISKVASVEWSNIGKHLGEIRRPLGNINRNSGTVSSPINNGATKENGNDMPSYADVFRGVPLDCWCEEFFLKLGWAEGEPLLLDSDTNRRRRLDRGRVLALIPYGVECPVSIKVIIRKSSVMIKTTEVQSPVDFGWISNKLGLHSGGPMLIGDQLNVGENE